MKYLFYARDLGSFIENILVIDDLYSFSLWKPRVDCIVPRGVSKMPFAIWWIMHHLQLFQSNDYSLFVVYAGKTLVHRSGVFPGYFRFPMMAKDDLQIGDTWTHPEHRKKGIALFAIQQILTLKSKPGRRFWYIVEENNLPSIGVIEKADFVKVGEGFRVKRFGLRLLGSFEMSTTSLKGDKSGLFCKGAP